MNMIDELENLLRTHDWSYDYSDDHSVWTRGKNERAAINQLMQQCKEAGLGPEADGLYDRYARRG